MESANQGSYEVAKESGLKNKKTKWKLNTITLDDFVKLAEVMFKKGNESSSNNEKFWLF